MDNAWFHRSIWTTTDIIHMGHKYRSKITLCITIKTELHELTEVLPSVEEIIIIICINWYSFYRYNKTWMHSDLLLML